MSKFVMFKSIKRLESNPPSGPPIRLLELFIMKLYSASSSGRSLKICIIRSFLSSSINATFSRTFSFCLKGKSIACDESLFLAWKFSFENCNDMSFSYALGTRPLVAEFSPSSSFSMGPSYGSILGPISFVVSNPEDSSSLKVDSLELALSKSSFVAFS